MPDDPTDDAARPGARAWVRISLAVMVAAGIVTGSILAVRQAQRVDPLAAHPPPDGYRVVGYWPEWETTGTGGYRAKDLPVDSLTALVYFRLGIADGKCVLADPVSDIVRKVEAADSVDGRSDPEDGSSAIRGNFQQLRELKAKHRDLKILVSIVSPWKGAKLDAIAADPAARSAFVASCLDLAIDGKVDEIPNATPAPLFDGIDLDWEFPAAKDRANFTELATEFRQQLDARRPGLVLTAAIPAWATADERYDLHKLSGILDWINLMAYDLRQGDDGRPTGFPAPLHTYGQVGDTAPIDTVVDTFERKGVTSGQIVLGLPLYGQRWAGVPADNGGLGQPSTGPADPDTMSYDTLRRLPSTLDETAAQAYAYDPSTKVFAAFDDPRTVAIKMSWVVQRGLGGAMLWQLGFDTADHQMLIAVNEGLRAATAAATSSAATTP